MARAGSQVLGLVCSMGCVHLCLHLVGQVVDPREGCRCVRSLVGGRPGDEPLQVYAVPAATVQELTLGQRRRGLNLPADNVCG